MLAHQPGQQTEGEGSGMHTQGIAYSRTPNDTRVMVVDGWGVSLKVNRGHLLVSDGLGPHRRERQISRVERELKRIIILNAKGTVTFDAIRWCDALGIQVIYADKDGSPILATTARNEDVRLRRAQAFAGAGGPHEETGLRIVKEILSRKLSGQAANLRNMGHEKAAQDVEQCAGEVENAPTVDLCRSWEGNAASIYWGAWVGTIGIPWLPSDAEKVPAHWKVYVSRASLTSGRARGATDPVNAMLNYCYRLAEIECILACQAVGLDPQFGFLHLDREARNSLALDLLEVIRPEIERYVLGLVGEFGNQPREFHRNDFLENGEGQCRILAPLTHELAEQAIKWARTLAPVVEEYAAMLAHSAGGSYRIGKPTQDKILMRKPAAGSRKKESAVRGSVVKKAPTVRQERSTPVPRTAHEVIPPDLWERVSEVLPKPRQTNKADQRLSKHGVLAGAVCTEILGVPGRHLPATIADRKTVRVHLQRWKADGTWDELMPVLTSHSVVQALMHSAGVLGDSQPQNDSHSSSQSWHQQTTDRRRAPGSLTAA